MISSNTIPKQWTFVSTSAKGRNVECTDSLLPELFDLDESCVEERFSEFFEKWMCQLDEYLQHLQKASEDYRAKTRCEREQELQASVSKVTQHYKDYYIIKWALAHEDVLAFFCPIWISPLENAYSWVTRRKPSAVLKLVNSIRTNGVLYSGLVELTQEQMKKIEALRVKIRLEEERVEKELERQQVAVADRKMAELVRLVVRVKNGEEVRQVEGLVQVALKGVMVGLKKVMKVADCVRLRTLKGVLDVLSLLQCVEFLADIDMLQILLRQWGKKRFTPLIRNF
ncbi:protein DOG1-like 4 [Hevea brasiliensis]|uniref:protein DOG1-like 4 n=1 Tax=Hevea brasiliensis TaxID=3981 RepID=UPI0025E73F41|nr:protein DOG1-like 4 [Hevea brasiliensis]